MYFVKWLNQKYKNAKIVAVMPYFVVFKANVWLGSACDCK